MRQLAKLAQAIAHGPRLLLLDEPTNGLDPPARQRMIRLIRGLHEQGGVRLVVSSHLLRDVEQCCGQVLILKDGRVVEHCDLERARRLDRRFLELETDRDGAAFAQAAQRLGCECALARERALKLVLPESLEIRDLYRLAAECGLRIRRLNYRRDSLEDIIMRQHVAALNHWEMAAAPPLSHLAAYLGVTALAVAGYGALFLLLGLVCRNPVIPAVLVLIWESVNLFLPPPLKQLSVIYYLESLCPLRVPARGGQIFAMVANPPSGPAAVAGLLCLCLALLAISALGLRRIEIRYGTE